MTIRATTLATEELRKVHEAGGPIHGLHSRADIGVLLAEITALRAEIATWEHRYEEVVKDRLSRHRADQTRIDSLYDCISATEAERDVYKRAKEENDRAFVAERMRLETERAAAEERARKAESRERFAWTCLRAPTPEGCVNCGRLVLTGGPCCAKPEFPPWPPPVAKLAQMYSTATLALRNVLALSRRLQKRRQLADEDANHFARFCESAGVEPSVLRTDDDG